MEKYGVNNQITFRGAIWIGLVFLLAGGGVMILSVTSGMEDSTTPHWIGTIFGLMFFNAGITVGLMDSGFDEFRKIKWLAYLHLMALLSIPLIFLTLFNWVAFGPGEREFSMSISIPFIGITFDRASEIIGRIFFGIPALLMDAALIYFLYGILSAIFNTQKDHPEAIQDENDQ